MRKVLFAFLLYCAGTPVKAQRQDLNLYGYNTAFGAVTGGIGAVINSRIQKLHGLKIRN